MNNKIGAIEEAIIINYKKALENGDFEQAKKATYLATRLRELIELDGFVDTQKFKDMPSVKALSVFKPITYSYSVQTGTVRIFNTLINLTEVENKLFELLSLNETTEDEIKLIRKNHIMNHIWPGKNVTSNAVRILVQRLRKKIEINPASPEVIINFNRKGYVFLGRSI